MRTPVTFILAALVACSPSDQTERRTETPKGNSNCGNDQLDPGEECDGSVPTDVSCGLLGLGTGSLSCGSNCRLVTSGCSGAPCGNGVLDAGEACDGTLFATSSDCSLAGYKSGTFGCTDTCILDDADCEAWETCGNGMLDAQEVCEGFELRGEDCESQGFDDGVLTCTDRCILNTSGCYAICGNDVRHSSQECDGDDLGDASCESMNFVGGTLACSDTCYFDTAACVVGPTDAASNTFAALEGSWYADMAAADVDDEDCVVQQFLDLAVSGGGSAGQLVLASTTRCVGEQASEVQCEITANLEPQALAGYAASTVILLKISDLDDGCGFGDAMFGEEVFVTLPGDEILAAHSSGPEFPGYASSPIDLEGAWPFRRCVAEADCWPQCVYTLNAGWPPTFTPTQDSTCTWPAP